MTHVLFLVTLDTKFLLHIFTMSLETLPSTIINYILEADQFSNNYHFKEPNCKNETHFKGEKGCKRTIGKQEFEVIESILSCCENDFQALTSRHAKLSQELKEIELKLQINREKYSKLLEKWVSIKKKDAHLLI